MQISKRHHIIPRFILKGFTFDGKRLYICDKKDRRIYKSSINNSFVEKNFYSYFDGKSKIDVPEKELAKLESRASRVVSDIENIINYLSRKRINNISVHIRSKIKDLEEYIFISMKRYGVFLEKIERSRYLKFVLNYLQLALPHQIVIKDVFPKIENIKQKIKLLSIMGVDEKILREFLKFETIISFSTRKLFVVSDCIFSATCIPSLDNRRFICFPLSKRICLLKGGPEFTGYTYFKELSPEDVRKINMAVTHNTYSKRVASSSKCQLQSLCNPR